VSAPVKPTMVETAVSTTPVYALDLASSVQDQVLTTATSVTSMPITTTESAYVTTTGLATTAHNTLQTLLVIPCCDSCTGPTNRNCTACFGNTFKNYQGACVCLPDWDGDNCMNYIGMCDWRCTSCNGPFRADCMSCHGVNTIGSP